MIPGTLPIFLFYHSRERIGIREGVWEGIGTREGIREVIRRFSIRLNPLMSSLSINFSDQPGSLAAASMLSFARPILFYILFRTFRNGEEYLMDVRTILGMDVLYWVKSFRFNSLIFSLSIYHSLPLSSPSHWVSPSLATGGFKWEEGVLTPKWIVGYRAEVCGD